MAKPQNDELKRMRKILGALPKNRTDKKLPPRKRTPTNIKKPEKGSDEVD